MPTNIIIKISNGKKDPKSKDSERKRVIMPRGNQTKGLEKNPASRKSGVQKLEKREDREWKRFRLFY
jgi:hypothetical protein